MTPTMLRIIFLLALGTISSVAADIPSAYSPQIGDFVFQSLPHGELVDTIEGVTDSAYSHVGLVVKKDANWYVREAVGPVRDTPLKTWIAHGRMNGAFDAYRLKEVHRRHIPELVKRSATFLGRPYDIRYEMDDEKIYCSELLYKSMLAASGEKVGRLQKFGDLNWRPYGTTIEKIEGGPAPLSREMITPRALAEGEQLEPLFRGYPTTDAVKKTPVEKPAPPSATVGLWKIDLAKTHAEIDAITAVPEQFQFRFKTLDDFRAYARQRVAGLRLQIDEDGNARFEFPDRPVITTSWYPKSPKYDIRIGQSFGMLSPSVSHGFKKTGPDSAILEYKLEYSESSLNPLPVHLVRDTTGTAIPAPEPSSRVKKINRAVEIGAKVFIATKAIAAARKKPAPATPPAEETPPAPTIEATATPAPVP